MNAPIRPAKFAGTATWDPVLKNQTGSPAL